MSFSGPGRVLGKLKRWYQRGHNLNVQLGKLLVGGECGIDSPRYARLIGEPLRSSRKLADSPHVKFLQQYQEIGDKIFEPAIFEQTPYYRNARQAMDFTGRYFDLRNPADIQIIARNFITHFLTGKSPHLASQKKRPSAIKVQPIFHSDCYEIVDGHHRLAIAFMQKKDSVRVRSRLDTVSTPLQSIVRDVLWQKGRHELYQPVPFPEFEAKWPLVRRCTDRLEMMTRFLTDKKLLPASNAAYLDVGSSYGWFVAQMQKLGFRVSGVELDKFAINVGLTIYDLQPAQLTRGDCVAFLRKQAAPIDVVSCFSVIHHFALGNASISAIELLQLLDRATKNVLFFDTGQNNEKWFRKNLKEWDPDYIEKWVRANSSFTQIYRLGIDQDRVAPYEENYSRTLFACMR